MFDLGKLVFDLDTLVIDLSSQQSPLVNNDHSEIHMIMILLIVPHSVVCSCHLSHNIRSTYVGTDTTCTAKHRVYKTEII